MTCEEFTSDGIFEIYYGIIDENVHLKIMITEEAEVNVMAFSTVTRKNNKCCHSFKQVLKLL